MSKKSRSISEIVNTALNLDGSPEKVARFYDQWAENYDKDVGDIDYVGPRIVAELLDKHTGLLGQHDRSDLNVLDAGCGTGLSGRAIHDIGFTRIYGFDISSEMAARAAGGGHYQSAEGGVDMMKADTHFKAGSFDIIVSVGVFTLGHVPPEALEILARLGRPGGLLALSTRVEYYDETNYQQVVDSLIESGRMRLVEQLERAHYLKGGSSHFWVFQISG
ncbi:MAG: methyltransferase domain-containing protein [Hyphomicrobiales bacterium]|nr:methyltransferase domain-containing protein [Hyphomicrobiales bacterium]MCP5001977.1 methyltransferase domain-containing protein [Hyphomicrobiales bacterium]